MLRISVEQVQRRQAESEVARQLVTGCGAHACADVDRGKPGQLANRRKPVVADHAGIIDVAAQLQAIMIPTGAAAPAPVRCRENHAAIVNKSLAGNELPIVVEIAGGRRQLDFVEARQIEPIVRRQIDPLDPVARAVPREAGDYRSRELRVVKGGRRR